MDRDERLIGALYLGRGPKRVPGIGWVWPKPGYEWRDGTVQLKEGYELFEGKPRKVVDGGRSGWWRLNEHYDRDGYCDNPGRGY